MDHKDTFSIHRKEDGTWEAKQHGYPFYFTGETAEECLSNAGKAADFAAKALDSIRFPEETPNAD